MYTRTLEILLKEMSDVDNPQRNLRNIGKFEGPKEAHCYISPLPTEKPKQKDIVTFVDYSVKGNQSKIYESISI